MEHDHLIAMLNRLKLTAIRDQLDSLVDEAARRELTIREALSLFCEREIARKDERRIETEPLLPGQELAGRNLKTAVQSRDQFPRPGTPSNCRN